MLTLMLTNIELFRTFNERLGPPPCDVDEQNDVLDLSRISSAARLSFRAKKLVPVYSMFNSGLSIVSSFQNGPCITIIVHFLKFCILFYVVAARPA